MKPLLPALALVLSCSFSLLSANADEAPALKAPDAAAIAQGDLASRGLESSVYIAELIYKGSRLLGGEPAHWEVMWSKEFDAQTEGRKEIGLKIKMDGTYTRSIR
ncbi:MAG: hypothetical protein HUU06_01875 [Planctomycetaceae bacterium]|nr:hypothetical protein [Planctomycetaceae bacterium]